MLILTCIPASSLLNWSYQNTSPCSVLVDENSEVVASSKDTTSETNLSTSSKPRPSSGGNYVELVSLRKRRHVPNPSHASVLNNSSSTPRDVDSTTEYGTHRTHASSSPLNSVAFLHEGNVSNSDVSLKYVDVSSPSSTNHPGDNLDSTESTDSQNATNTNRKENLNYTEINNTAVEQNIATETSIQNQEDSTINTADFAASKLPLKSTKVDVKTSTESYLDEYDSNENLGENLSNEDPDQTVKIFDDFNNSTEMNQENENDIIKVKPEDLDLPLDNAETDARIKKAASSALSSAENIQHDYPVFSYGQDEVEIVKLNHDPLSTTMKSKIAYNSGTLKEKSGFKDPNILNNEANDGNLTDGSSKELTDYNLAAAENHDFVYDLKNPNLNPPALKMHERVDFNNSTNATNKENFPDSDKPRESPKVKVIEVPPLTTGGANSSKRIVVNVTIATEPNYNSPHATQNVYVLSVSVPTGEDPNEMPDVNLKSHTEPLPATLNQQKTELVAAPLNTLAPDFSTGSSFGFSGGECQCSCPCLDDYDNFTETNSTDDYLDEIDTLLLQNVTVSTSSYDDFVTRNFSHTTTIATDNISSSTESPTTSPTWTTDTACIEVTTKLPPPPTILILEGRAASFLIPLGE